MTRLASTLLLTLLATGCAGARSDVTFNQARYPVSMTPCVPGPDGTHLGEADLQRVGTFEATSRGYGTFYTGASGGVDFSEELNEQVEKVGGDAVIKVGFHAGESGWNAVWPLNWLPFYPGNVIITATGDIVRAGRRDKSSIRGCN